MVKALLGIILVLCGLGIPAWSLPASDSPAMTTVAQDSAGTVWAMPTDSSGDGTLRRWQSGAWAVQAVPDAAGFRARVLTRGDDGSVYAFWQQPTQWQPKPQTPQCLVTVHRGLSSRTLARFPGTFVREVGFTNIPTLYAGTEGDVWLIGYQPLLRHISRDGSIQDFPIKPDQYFDRRLPGDYESSMIGSMVDGTGRRWFWQEGPHHSWDRSGFRGVLIWDGKTLAYHPTLPGVPDQPFSVLAPLDTGHLWLAVPGIDFAPGGLYRVDTGSLSVEQVAPPLPDAFQNIVQIFRANNEWYVLEQQQYDPMPVLWRGQAGQWRKCLDRFEEVGGYSASDIRHPWLAEPSGVWVGNGRGAWWLPRNDGVPLMVDWRRGLAAQRISGLFPLTDGRILAVGGLGDSEIPAAPQPIRPLPPGVVTGGLGAPKNLGALLADTRQHLWGTSVYDPQTSSLNEWDGLQWHRHQPPKDVTGITGIYDLDTLGRVWMSTSNWNPPSQPKPVEGRAVYDPTHDTWTNYVTVPHALQAAAALPGMGFLPLRGTYDTHYLPSYSGDGRVAYCAAPPNTDIYLYDGQAWRHWEARDIVSGYSYSGLSDSPYFNHDGHLEIALPDQLWEWASGTGWQPTGMRKPQNAGYFVPPGGPSGLGVPPAVDSLGADWFAWKGMVYTLWHGLWATQAELSGPGSPFRAGFDIEDVARDPLGRLFFVTRPAGYYDLVVWSPPPVPKPTLSLIPTTDDSVTAHIQTKLQGSHWFLWRLNDGAWSTPQTTDTVRLTALAHGDYRMEVQMLDERLQPSPPAVAVFSIRVTSDTQISRWVRALLNGSDAEREAAVAGLVKQPAAALLALQAPHPGISESARWWLDAAIQQIMDQRQKAEDKKN